MDSGELMSYGARRPRPLHHDLRPLRARVHGRPRPPLRHLGPERRLALAVAVALDVGLHRPASSRALKLVRRPVPLLARGHLPEHRQLRPAAAAGRGTRCSSAREWHGGRTSWEGWGESTDAARAEFAKLVGHRAVPRRDRRDRLRPRRPRGRLPAGRQPRARPGDRVHLHPLPVPRPAGLAVTTVPTAQLAASIDERTDVVAFSAVQMSTGEVADLDAILAAAEAHDVVASSTPPRPRAGCRCTPTASTSSSPPATSG